MQTSKRRTFRQNDRIVLLLPMAVTLSRWPKGGIGVERGPLVFALPVKENRQVDQSDPNQTMQFPAWNLYPASDWNYALALDPQNLDDQIEVVHHPAQLNPWSVDTAPIPNCLGPIAWSPAECGSSNLRRMRSRNRGRHP